MTDQDGWIHPNKEHHSCTLHGLPRREDEKGVPDIIGSLKQCQVCGAWWQLTLFLNRRSYENHRRLQWRRIRWWDFSARRAIRNHTS